MMGIYKFKQKKLAHNSGLSKVVGHLHFERGRKIVGWKIIALTDGWGCCLFAGGKILASEMFYHFKNASGPPF